MFELSFTISCNWCRAVRSTPESFWWIKWYYLLLLILRSWQCVDMELQNQSNSAIKPPELLEVFQKKHLSCNHVLANTILFEMNKLRNTHTQKRSHKPCWLLSCKCRAVPASWWDIWKKLVKIQDDELNYLKCSPRRDKSSENWGALVKL